MQNELKLYHPICHHINGQRIYYILVSLKPLKKLNSDNSVFDEIEKLINKDRKPNHNDGIERKEKSLAASCCAYITYGEHDVLIRAWADEYLIDDFIKELVNQEWYKTHSCNLIHNMSTWYQRDLESSMFRVFYGK